MNTEWNEAFTHIVITPTQQLALGTGYTLKLDSQAQAAGGGSLSQGLDWDFTTVPPPAILSTNPANGSTQGSFASELFIKFASPMRIDTVKSRIDISPTEKEIEWWYNDWDWSMVAFMLNPSTSYTVRFLAGMEDIYGNDWFESCVRRAGLP